MPEQLGEAELSPVRRAPDQDLWANLISFVSANDEGSLWATLWYWPGAVSFRNEKIVFTLPLEDLAATYSPAS